MKSAKIAVVLAVAAFVASPPSTRVGHADDAPPTAGARARAQLERDADLGRLPYDALFARPFLMCRQREPVPDGAPGRTAARDAHAARVLAERARIATQVYARFLALFGERCALRPLDAAPAGEPTTTPIIYTFLDKRLFTECHERAAKAGPIASGVATFLVRATGNAYAYEDEGGDRQFEARNSASLATLSLLHAFARQRGDRSAACSLPLAFETGLAEWMSGFSMAKDRTLTFDGIDRTRLAILKQLEETLSKANRKMFVFPSRDLLRFEGYGDAQAFGVRRWNVDPDFVLLLFHLQSWEFVHFLDTAENGRRRAAIGDLLDAWLGHAVTSEQALEDVGKALALASDADWAALDKEFDAHRRSLLRLDLSSLRAPPSLDDWPGYVAPDLEAPTGSPIK